ALPIAPGFRVAALCFVDDARVVNHLIERRAFGLLLLLACPVAIGIARIRIDARTVPPRTRQVILVESRAGFLKCLLYGRSFAVVLEFTQSVIVILQNFTGR